MQNAARYALQDVRCALSKMERRSHQGVAHDAREAYSRGKEGGRERGGKGGRGLWRALLLLEREGGGERERGERGKEKERGKERRGGGRKGRREKVGEERGGKGGDGRKREEGREEEGGRERGRREKKGRGKGRGGRED
jgi:hypothetical protein